MEIIELSITAEESENYRKITNRLKVLLQKYLFTGFADKIFAGEIRPSRVKILKDKMIVYCKVYND